MVRAELPTFKDFVATDPARRDAIFTNLTTCARHVAALAARTGLDLHLGLEPEPLCQLETTEETVAFFAEWRARMSTTPTAAHCLRFFFAWTGPVPGLGGYVQAL